MQRKLGAGQETQGELCRAKASDVTCRRPAEPGKPQSCRPELG